MPAPKAVHVIDDDDAMRHSMEFLLRSARYAVRTYESASAFLDRLASAEPGCIVTDVRMPGMSGIELLQQLNERDADFPVIVMTGHGDIQLAVSAMKIGAADFLEKPFDDEVMLAAIRAALEREPGDDDDAERKAQFRARINALSAREREVIERLVAGKPNKIIAYDLGISPRTVEVYRANVMTKMQAGSLSELVRMALLAGIE
jgi:two-component system response regulator FixJ